MVKSPFVRVLLFIPAQIYKLAVQIRIYLYRRSFLATRKLDTPVISIGNITVGGTGKTPCAAYIANLLKENDLEVAILSRGYKRTGKGLIQVSDGNKILASPQEAGDEPYLLAGSCPGVRVIVDKDRYSAGQWLEKTYPVAVMILDDGYQHLRLARDLNILLVDATEPLWSAEMAPLGRLREPLTEMRRADAIILTRSDTAHDPRKMESLIRKYCKPEIPVFHSQTRISEFKNLQSGEFYSSNIFSGKRPAVISGIAKPDNFISDLSKTGLNKVLRRDFRDHHKYREDEINTFIRDARNAGADVIITTEKDAVKMSSQAINASELPVFAAVLKFQCFEEAELLKLMHRVVG